MAEDLEIYLLYFDEERGRPKVGAAVKTKKPGTLRRFVDVIRQFDLTYDFYSMTGQEILALLPAEFDRFRPGAS